MVGYEEGVSLLIRFQFLDIEWRPDEMGYLIGIIYRLYSGQNIFKDVTNARTPNSIHLDRVDIRIPEAKPTRSGAGTE